MAIAERDILASQLEITTPQGYEQEMNEIWQRVSAIQQQEERSTHPNSTNFDLWKLSQNTTPLTPDNYPSLAEHGLIKQEKVEGGMRWKPTFPHLQDFWGIGAAATFMNGYRILPQAEFEHRLQAKIQKAFPVNNTPKVA